MKISLAYLFFTLSFVQIIAQQRWTNNYLPGQNPFGESISTYYDKGYLIAGRYGPNYPQYNWLIKTDVNGEILWNKTLGHENDYLILTADIDTDDKGSIYLVGSTYDYSIDNCDPIVMKLNKCGEKEWCRVFVAEDNNYSNAIKGTDDGGCVVLLRYMNPDATKDRICLTKLASNGEQIWNKCYNSPDTSILNGDAYDITVCPDSGYLITGLCGYEDQNPPHYIWVKPYYIKTDSLGNFEWETVVHSDTIEPGGAAWSTILSPDSNFFYSFISHYYHNPTQNAPALVKMDMQGQVVGVYDLAEKDDLGKLFQATFINDSILAGSASWGSEEYSSPKAVLFDTLGNILDSAFLVDNHYLSYVRKTFDNKLLFLTNKYDEELDEFDAYLFKLNTELESDSIYTQQFNYDSLCPYQIESDTIVQDNCGLIVGGEEIFIPKEDGLSGIEVYPNPATSKFIIRCSLFDIQKSTVAIFDLFGRKVKEIKVPKGKEEIIVDIESWQRGLYLLRVSSGDGFSEGVKVVIE